MAAPAPLATGSRRRHRLDPGAARSTRPPRPRPTSPVSLGARSRRCPLRPPDLGRVQPRLRHRLPDPGAARSARPTLAASDVACAAPMLARAARSTTPAPPVRTARLDHACAARPHRPPRARLRRPVTMRRPDPWSPAELTCVTGLAGVNVTVGKKKRNK
jgi:hypothetical protein